MIATTTQQHPQLVFVTTVTQVVQLSATMRRVTVTGPDLRAFGVDEPILDLRIKLLLPATSDGSLAAELFQMRPELPADPEYQGWYRRWLQLDPAVRGVMRTYTVRAFREAGETTNTGAEPELDIDLVLHGGESSGPGSQFAQAAQPGDSLLILGPNRNLSGPPYAGIEFRPAGATKLLIIGDETALPAIASILETLPRDCTGQVLIEVGNDDDRLELLAPPDLEVTYLVRSGQYLRGQQLVALLPQLDLAALTGITPDTPLTDTASHPGTEPEDIDVDHNLLWETATSSHSPQADFYAWIAGEAGTVKDLRRYLVRDVGIDRDRIAFMGYWRKGKSEG